MGYRDWTTMGGYVQRMKEEADRKEQEELRKKQEEEEARRRSQMQDWRRDVPIGPPTREQAFNVPAPSVEKPVDKSKITLPSMQQPTFQVGQTQPPVSTQTPEVGASQPTQRTTQSHVQTPTSVGPQIQQPQPYSDLLDAWQLPTMAPRNAAVAQPTAPGLLAQELPGLVKPMYDAFGNAVQNFAGSMQPEKWLQQMGQNNMFGAIASPLANLAGQMMDPTTPLGTLVDLTGERIEQREKERAAFSVVSSQQGPLGQLTSNLSKVSPTRLLGGSLDIFQALGESAGLIPVTPNMTLGQVYATAREAADLASVDQSGTRAFHKVGDEWGKTSIFSLKAWAEFGKSLGNTAEYWSRASSGVLDAVTPTDAQTRQNSPEQIAKARALALVMAHHGVAAMAETFDNYLDYPNQANTQLQKAAEMAKYADSIADPVMRQQYWAEAGRMNSEAVKLREMTPLEIYNKNQNWGYSLPFEMIFGLDNVLGELSNLGQLSPAARRYRQAQRVVELQAAGANKNWLKDNLLVDWAKTNRSKALVDAYTNFSVLANLLSGVQTKGDIVKVFTRYAQGQLQNGISVAELTSPDAMLQAINGVVHFGYSGAFDARAVKAAKSLAGLENWIAHVPSLQGATDEIANKFEVTADLLGMLIRGAAGTHGSSAMKGIPYGAEKFRVVMQTNRKAVVEFLDSAGNVMGRTAEMAQGAANRFATDAEKALRTGKEFKTNYVQAVGDFQRNFLSTFTLNSNPGAIITNAMGGNLTHLMDMGFSGDYFKPLDKQLDWLLDKVGGMYASARLAEGAGGVALKGSTFGSQNVPTGFTGFMGKLANIATLGTAGIGRKLRQGSATLPGGRIKVGEEAIYASIYYAAFKNFFEREWSGRGTKAIRDILKQAGVQDEKSMKHMIDSIIEAGMVGNRVDVARAFNDIANGRVSLSLRSLGESLYSLFDADQVKEINTLLKNVNPENLGQVGGRIRQIINAQRALLQREGAEQAFTSGRRFFTEWDDNADVADILDTFQNAAGKLGLSADEATQRGTTAAQNAKTIQENILILLQQVEDQPHLIKYVYDVWGKVRAMKDLTRARVGQLAEELGQAQRDAQAAYKVAKEQWDEAMAAWNAMPQGMTPGSIIPDDVRDSMQIAYRLSDEETEIGVTLLEARAITWGQMMGVDPAEYFRKHLGGFLEVDNPRILGSFAPGMPGQSWIQASKALFDGTWSKNDQLKVLVHEIGHLFHHDLAMAATVTNNAEAIADYNAVKKIFGFTDDYFNDSATYGSDPKMYEAFEAFADGFVNYLRTGDAVAGLARVYQRFRLWLQNLHAALEQKVMGRVSATGGESTINPVYDALFKHTPTGRPAQPVEPTAPDFSVNWQAFYEQAQQQWDEFGQQAIEQIERARESIASGRAAQEIYSGLQPLGDDLGAGTYGYDDILSDLSYDPAIAVDALKLKLGWRSQDPQWEYAVGQYRKALDYWQSKAFTALSRYPNMNSFDEFMSAFADVKDVRSKVLGKIRGAQARVNDPEVRADPDELKKAYAILKRSKDEWKTYWKYSWDRFQAAAYRIVELNLPEELTEGLRFIREGDVQPAPQWKLIGPSLQAKNLWEIATADGKKALAHVGPGGVPQRVIDEFYRVRRIAEMEVAEQVGRLGSKVALDQGAVAADNLLAGMGGKEYKDIYSQVRRSVLERVAAYKRDLDMPNDLNRWYGGMLDVAEHSLTDILQDVAMMNRSGYGKLNSQVISNFNKQILSLFDNVIAGAQKYGDEMTSMSVLDYTNTYHPDVLLGLGSPYHFFWTRQGKNALERMLFNPKVSLNVLRFMRTVEAQNRRDNMPNRNIQSIPGGVTIDDATYRLGANLLPRWIPVFPLMVMNGWADPGRANRAYEMVVENSKEQAFPATARGAHVVYYAELAKELGLSLYPWWDAGIGALAGEELSLQGQMAEMSPLWRALGWASVRFADDLKNSKIPGIPALQELVQYLGVPEYAPYLYGREASFQAQQGKLTDSQAEIVQDVAYQDFSGEGPMPEQQALMPNAPQVYRQMQENVSTEYLVKALIAWATGAPIATVYHSEQELRDARETKSHMDYEPSFGVAGSQSAYFSSTDPESANFQPGLEPFEQQYAVTAERGVQQPAEVDRPGLKAAQDAYYTQRKEITERFKEEKAQAYRDNPAWSTRQGSKDASAYDKEWEARRDAELKALAEKFPSVALQEGEEFPDPTPYSLYGARPQETLEAAQERLLSLAYENVEHLRPEAGAPSGKWDIYNQALEEELTRLMNDPQQASAVVFDRALPRTQEKAAGSTSDVLRGPYEVNELQTRAPLSQEIAVNSNNPYAQTMAAAEQKYGLPAGLLEAVALNESNFDPEAKSGAGAMGLMQIMPATWEEWSAKVGVDDPWNPDDSIEVSAAYLQWLMNTMPEDQRDIYSIMVAYNWGIGNVQKKGIDQAPPETKAYSNTIASSVGTVPTTESVAAVGRPFEGDHRLTQEFGVNPERYKSWGGHMGLDYSMPVGTPLLATEGATVVATGYSPAGGTPSRPGTGGFGNWVILDMGNGYTVEYAHLDKIQVNAGDKVTAGQVIGLSGHTGVSDFPHLHFGVKKDGKYISPHDYLNRQATAMPSEVAPPAEGSNHAPPPATAEATTATGDGIAWGKSAADIIESGRNRNKPAEEIAAEKQVSAEFQAIEDAAKKTYPQYAHLYDEYRMLTEEEKPAFKQANPMIRALHLAGYSPKEWAYVEKTFGKGIVEKWALVPRGDDIGEAAGDYYRKHPDVFLAKAWIQGRPQPYSDELPDPTQPFEYNFGKDYETAKEMFGADIWNIVREYYTIPKYVRGGDNTAWIAFKEKYPQYDQWRIWWYALMGGEATTSTFQRGGFGGFSGGFGGYDPSQGEHPMYVENVDPLRAEPPSFGGWRGGSSGDWRKYLQLGEVQLRGWRR